MELRQLRTFLAVVEEGSVTGGARRLFMSQPAVTRQLQALERSLGGPLLERHLNGVRPTAAGELLAHEARRLLGAADRISERVAGAHEDDGHRRLLRLGVFLGRLAAAELTEPIVTTFRSRYPEVTLDVRTLPLSDPWGRRQDFDVLLYKGPGAEHDDVSVLFEEPHVASFSTGHRLMDRAVDGVVGMTAEDLADEVIQDASDLYRPVDRDFFASCDLRDIPELAGVRRFALTPGTRYDQILAGAAVGAFVNVTVGSVARLADAPGLRHVPVRDVPPAATCVAVRHPGPAAEAFRATALHVTRDLLPLVPEARSPRARAASSDAPAPSRRPPRQRAGTVTRSAATAPARPDLP